MVCISTCAVSPPLVTPHSIGCRRHGLTGPHSTAGGKAGQGMREGVQGREVEGARKAHWHLVEREEDAEAMEIGGVEDGDGAGSEGPRQGVKRRKAVPSSGGRIENRSREGSKSEASDAAGLQQPLVHPAASAPCSVTEESVTAEREAAWELLCGLYCMDPDRVWQYLGEVPSDWLRELGVRCAPMQYLQVSE